MRISIPYYYTIKALVGRNRTTTTNFIRTGVFEADILEVSNLEPFLQQKGVSYDTCESTDKWELGNEYYFIDGAVYDMPRRQSLTDQFYYLFKRETYSGVNPDGRHKDSIIPDNVHTIVSDNKDEIIEYLRQTTGRMLFLNGKLMERKTEPMYLMKVGEDGSYAIWDEKMSDKGIPLAYDDIKNVNVINIDNYKVFGKIGDVNVYDDEHNEIIFHLLLKRLARKLPSLSIELMTKFVDFRETLLDLDVDKDELHHFLMHRRHKEMSAFKEVILGENTAIYSTEYLLDVYRELKSETGIIISEIEALMTMYEKRAENTHQKSYRR